MAVTIEPTPENAPTDKLLAQGTARTVNRIVSAINNGEIGATNTSSLIVFGGLNSGNLTTDTPPVMGNLTSSDL